MSFDDLSFDEWWDSLTPKDKEVTIETEYQWFCYDGIDSCFMKFTAEVDIDLFYEFCKDSDLEKPFDEMLEIYKEQNEENWIEEYIRYKASEY